ncbi:MAG: hypothetical protein MJ133_10215 [Lachnospiraceae bacterium]|nr:hypothetical protein [Lachnospiraceae bacterium]
MAAFDIKINEIRAEFSIMSALEAELKKQSDTLAEIKRSLPSFGKNTSALLRRLELEAKSIDEEARNVYKMKESLEDVLRAYMIKEALITGDVSSLIAVFGDKVYDWITDKSKEFKDLLERWKKNSEKTRDNVLNRIRDDETRNGFSDEYKDKLQQLYDDVPKEYLDARDLYDKHIENLKVAEFDAEKSYQINGEIHVNQEEDLDNPRGAGTTYYHEYGHYIVNNEGWVKGHSATGQFKEFEDSLRREVGNYISAYENQYREEGIARGYSGARLESYIENNTRSAITLDLNGPNNENLHVNDGLSDIIGGVSNNKYVASYGHANGYWDANPSRVPNEAFAEIFSAQMTGDTIELARMKEIFPDTYKIYCDMISSATKG